MGKYVRHTDLCKWEHDHPYYKFDHYPAYSTALRTYPFSMDTMQSEEERIHMLYIWHSLTNCQNYDAGQSILLAIEYGDIKKYNVLRISKLMLLYNRPWGGLIGNICHVSVLRSLALACEDISYSDVAESLWSKAVIMTDNIFSESNRKSRKDIESIKESWLYYISSMPKSSQEILENILKR